MEIDLRRCLIGYGRADDDIEPVLKERFREMDRTPVESEAERNEYQRGFDKKLNDHLDEIDLPARVLVGAYDEPLLLRAADYLAGRLSDHPAVVIEDAAHLPSMEQPEQFNTALRAFLDSN